MEYILFTHISIVNVIISSFGQPNNRYMYTPFGMIHDVDANFLSVLHWYNAQVSHVDNQQSYKTKKIGKGACEYRRPFL